MKILTLALRNLLRNRRRSLATALAMTVGLTAILIFGGYCRNAINATQTGYVQYHGHLQIQHKDFFLYGSGNPASYGIRDYLSMIDLIKRDPVLAPMLTVVTPLLQLSGIAANSAAGISKNVIAAGVVADDQSEMHKWDDYGAMTYSPPVSLTGTGADAVVIGTGVARTLQLCTLLQGSDCPQASSAHAAAGAGPAAIEMLVARPHGAPSVAKLAVVKAENWGVKEIDDVLIALHLPQAQRLIYGAGAGQVTAIQIQLRHTSQMAAAQTRLRELLAAAFKDAPLAVIDYETLTPIYGQIIQFFYSVFGFIAVLIGAIVLFTVGTTMSMAVVERTTEIGVLRAIGQRRGGIRRQFVCEAMLLGALGAVLGVSAAMLIAQLINHSGLSWAPPGYSYAYPVVVRIWGDPDLIAGSVVGLIAVAAISAWWPARRAAKLEIVDALRHV